MKLMASEEGQSLFMKCTRKNTTANTAAWSKPELMEGLNGVEEHQVYINQYTARTLSVKHSEYMDTVCSILQRYLLNEISFEECIEQGQAEIDKLLN
jgi:hypothetical protein